MSGSRQQHAVLLRVVVEYNGPEPSRVTMGDIDQAVSDEVNDLVTVPVLAGVDPIAFDRWTIVAVSVR